MKRIIEIGACVCIGALLSGCTTKDVKAMKERVNIDGKIAGVEYLEVGQAAAVAYNPALAPFMPAAQRKAAAAVNPVLGIEPDSFWVWTGEDRMIKKNDKIEPSDFQHETHYVVIKKPTAIATAPIELPTPPPATNTNSTVSADVELTDEQVEALAERLGKVLQIRSTDTNAAE